LEGFDASKTISSCICYFCNIHWSWSFTKELAMYDFLRLMPEGFPSFALAENEQYEILWQYRN